MQRSSDHVERVWTFMPQLVKPKVFGQRTAEFEHFTFHCYSGFQVAALGAYLGAALHSERPHRGLSI